jgi:hypothetical protein
MNGSRGAFETRFAIGESPLGFDHKGRGAFAGVSAATSTKVQKRAPFIAAFIYARHFVAASHHFVFTAISWGYATWNNVALCSAGGKLSRRSTRVSSLQRSRGSPIGYERRT